jgi:methionyl-tRNA formyltransferase
VKKLILFINGKLGLDILKFLIQSENTLISAVVINSPKKIKPEYKSQVSKILSNAGVEVELFQYSEKLWEDSEFSRLLADQIFGISVLFGHIFPESAIGRFNRNLINLHPSLLPIGRGADPIFWSIVEELPQGASIHRIDKSIDTGEIFIQEEIRVNSWLNSGQIYDLAMEKLYQLFIEFYPRWDTSTPSTPQVGEGTYHEARALAEIKSEILESPGIIYKQLNLIQALTYNNDKKARIVLPSKEIWEVSLQITRIQG